MKPQEEKSRWQPESSGERATKDARSETPLLGVSGGCSILWMANSQRAAFWSNNMLVWPFRLFVKEICFPQEADSRTRIWVQIVYLQSCLGNQWWEVGQWPRERKVANGSWVNEQVTAVSQSCGDWGRGGGAGRGDLVEDRVKVLQRCHRLGLLHPIWKLGSCSIYTWATNPHMPERCSQGY